MNERWSRMRNFVTPSLSSVEPVRGRHQTEVEHMYIRHLDDLLERRRYLRVSLHALREAYKEGLRGKDILHAIFRGRVIECYPDRDRVLVAGRTPRENVTLHVVCDYTDAREIVAVTVYIPNRTEWAGNLIRRRRHAK